MSTEAAETERPWEVLFLVQLFVRLPLASLDRLARRQRIQALAEKETAS
jgi:hypothetical protein